MDPSDVSLACGQAWGAYAATNASPDNYGEVEATATLNDCSTPAEWWAGSKPYADEVFLIERSMDEMLDLWCVDADAQTVVCLAR